MKAPKVFTVIYSSFPRVAFISHPYLLKPKTKTLPRFKNINWTFNQCSYGVKASCGESPPPSRLGGLRRRLGGLKRLGGPKQGSALSPRRRLGDAIRTLVEFDLQQDNIATKSYIPALSVLVLLHIAILACLLLATDVTDYNFSPSLLMQEHQPSSQHFNSLPL